MTTLAISSQKEPMGLRTMSDMMPTMSYGPVMIRIEAAPGPNGHRRLR
jgi:hypothetical protein